VFFAALGETTDCGEHHQLVSQLLKPGFDLEAAREEDRKAGVADCFDTSDLHEDMIDSLNTLRERGLCLGIAGD